MSSLLVGLKILYLLGKLIIHSFSLLLVQIYKIQKVM